VNAVEVSCSFMAAPLVDELSALQAVTKPAANAAAKSTFIRSLMP
jgi:hypothetical protein